MNLSEILEGGIRPGADIGQADPEREGAYRRGYHQAIAEVMYTLQAGAEINADSLSQWVEEEGMEWRKDKPLDRMIIAPALPKKVNL